ncbi:hypothetical protein HCH52_01730 [Oscillospiraceae bacterium HV4-5-C5C]|nr:hypothetical protein [Oscillospiraceae bacterium HV4-5-C5C]
MNLQKKIQDIVEKLKSDPQLRQKFTSDPVGTASELVGVDFPQEQMQTLVSGIKAKLGADDISAKLSGFGKLF